VRDDQAAYLSFDERWPRLDEAIRVLRAQLKTGEPAFVRILPIADVNEQLERFMSEVVPLV
jgi:alkanesulfonate monooxygenase SsuD/methylene tetrahydromethanopterin reductase-like flavin-dependent oxidoreductase (luciferase family)